MLRFSLLFLCCAIALNIGIIAYFKNLDKNTTGFTINK
jgi:hypothetical protein